MSCDHDAGICALPFRDDLTLREYIERLVHIGFLSAAVLNAFGDAA